MTLCQITQERKGEVQWAKAAPGTCGAAEGDYEGGSGEVRKWTRQRAAVFRESCRAQGGREVRNQTRKEARGAGSGSFGLPVAIVTPGSAKDGAQARGCRVSAGWGKPRGLGDPRKREAQRRMESTDARLYTVLGLTEMGTFS